MTLDDRIAGLACHDVLDQLGEYADGTLPGPARAQLEAHVAGCGACAAFGGAYGALVAALRERLTPAPLADDVAARLAARLAADA
ncbi:MAG: zf-HC2 domain-containing protein [Kofleriaceae bacterium]